MGKLPRPTGKEMLKFLESQGFVCVRITGSHHIMEKESLHLSLPVHGNEVVKIGTLRSILRAMELSAEEFSNLW
jgi:predicted RNA binding protein YcfA (HicA-like mRNA interferase family)